MHTEFITVFLISWVALGEPLNNTLNSYSEREKCRRKKYTVHTFLFLASWLPMNFQHIFLHLISTDRRKEKKNKPEMNDENCSWRFAMKHETNSWVWPPSKNQWSENLQGKYIKTDNLKAINLINYCTPFNSESHSFIHRVTIWRNCIP